MSVVCMILPYFLQKISIKNLRKRLKNIYVTFLNRFTSFQTASQATSSSIPSPSLSYLDNSYIFIVMMAQFSQKVLGQARKTRGYLQKRSSGLLSIWQRRYFLILQEGLSYYADETLEEVKKTIPMQQIKNIKVRASLQFELVTKKRIYQLRAEDEATRDLWVASLNILVNHKEWTLNANQTKKENYSSKRHSKNKRLTPRNTSPPLSSKVSTTSSVAHGLPLEGDFTAQAFFSFVCLPKLAELWGRESIRSKALVLKEAKGCYFLISCKSLLHPQEDPEFLWEEVVYPYDFNCLYFLEFAVKNPPQVVEICKCSEFESVEAEPGTIRIQLPKRGLAIRVEQKRMEVVDVQGIIKKLRAAAVIGKEYHNSHKIKIRRNIDPLLYKFETRQMSIEQIVRKQFENCLKEARQGKDGKDIKEGKETSPSKAQFKKNLQNLRRHFREVVNCCEAKGNSASQFKQFYVISFNEIAYQYVQKGWSLLGSAFSSFQIKKVIIILQEFWRVAREWIDGQSSLHLGAVAILGVLVQRYEQEIIGKINSCFLLSEEELIGQVSIPVKGQEEVLSKVETVFISNKIFRQFHLDIRLVLYEFSQMPVHQKSLQCYLSLFAKTFRYLSELTFKFLDKWRDLGLILGTCNEIQFIKNSLFQEMFDKLTRDYPQMSGKLKRQSLRQLEGEVNNIQIMLVKKLFVLTFSDIDRNLLNKPYDILDVAAISNSILDKLKALPKVNRYVRRNIFDASFEEICYFYYTSIIKFARGEHEEGKDGQYFARKIAEDIKLIGQLFNDSIPPQKIYAHLKDLSLIKEFLQCQPPQVKKLCQQLKKQFGNSFTEIAVKNLLALRQGPPQLKDGLLVECTQIVKNSADTPEEISLISSCRDSFLENWNNTRSRKSTLTLSLNEFYENQHAIQAGKMHCAQFKQGFLFRKKLNKELPQSRSFFSLRNGELLEHAGENIKGEVIAAYDLSNVRKCYLHPQKNYIFLLQLGETRLQFKAQTGEQAKEWVKNIYEEISSLTVTQQKGQKQALWGCASGMIFSNKQKDPSTMDSFQRQKQQSQEHSLTSSPKMKRKKQEKGQPSPERSPKVQKEKVVPEDICLKCSKGFFF